MDKKQVIEMMNKALEQEMGAVVRYLHHSFVVFGPSRIPIISWFQKQADESVRHATMLGQKIAAMGGHPTVKVEEVFEPGDQTIDEMMKEDLEVEKNTLKVYHSILKLVQDDVPLDQLMRGIISEEQTHVEELEMLMRRSK